MHSKLQALMLATATAVAGACAADDPTDIDSTDDAPESVSEDLAEQEFHRAMANKRGVTLVNEERLNLITKVDLGDDQWVKFFEPAPGILVTVEGIRTDGPSSAGLPTLERYEFLTGDPAPAALVDAAARAGQRSVKTDLGSEVGLVETGDPQSTDGLAIQKADPGYTITSSSFRNYYCKPTDRNWLWTGVTGDSWIKISGTEYLRSGARLNSGNGIRYKVHYNIFDYQPDLIIDADLKPGFHSGVDMGSQIGYDSKSEVYYTQTNGVNDNYDHCVNYHY